MEFKNDKQKLSFISIVAIELLIFFLISDCYFLVLFPFVWPLFPWEKSGQIYTIEKQTKNSFIIINIVKLMQTKYKQISLYSLLSALSYVLLSKLFHVYNNNYNNTCFVRYP